MPYCSECGKEIAVGSSFCKNCEKKLDDIQNNIQNPVHPSSTRASNKSILAMICGIIIFILLLYYMHESNNNLRAAGGLFAFILSLPSIVLGIISLAKHEDGKAFSITGIILGTLCILLATDNVLSHSEENRAASNEARQMATKLKIESLEASLKLYKLDNGSYPTTEQGLKALVETPTGAINWRQGGYLEKMVIPKDSWGNEFIYISPGNHGDFDLTSFGADGKPGGEGFDKDINNWEFE